MMANSMTGFGHGEAVLNGKKVSCDVKSINNRYCDIQVRLPRALFSLEGQVRDLARSYISRGKVDFSINTEELGEESRRVFCDIPLAEGYKAALEELGAVLGRPCLIQVGELATYPGVLQAEAAESSGDEWLPALSAGVENALEALCEMRRAEGERLTQDILERCERLECLREQIVARAPQVVLAYREKLRGRIRELLGDEAERFVEPQRMAAEVLLFVDKAAIDEELVRLLSHFSALRETVRADGPVGKKLDFLVQEINREVNTIGSKANDLEITTHVVEMKSEIEKIREQIQNLE